MDTDNEENKNKNNLKLFWKCFSCKMLNNLKDGYKC